MTETYKSIKAILREHRIYNSLNKTKLPVYEDVDEMIANIEKDMDLDITPIDYEY